MYVAKDIAFGGLLMWAIAAAFMWVLTYGIDNAWVAVPNTVIGFLWVLFIGGGLLTAIGALIFIFALLAWDGE